MGPAYARRGSSWAILRAMLRFEPSFRLAIAVAAFAVAVVSASDTALVPTGVPTAVPTSLQKLPPRLESYLTRHVRLTADQRTRLVRGEPVTRILETSDPSREVAVFGAVWVAAPPARYVEAIKDIERFESGGNFLVTKRISSPPRLDDFAALRLPPDDVADLRGCRVGSCELKVSEATLARVKREVDWTKPTATGDVEALARRLAFDYVNGYMAGGNARLAVYRDNQRPTYVAQEFASMIDRLPALSEHLPAVRRALLEYPGGQVPGSESFFYWQEAKFGLKPTLRVNHVLIAPDADGVVVATKMLYASHYFWTALELRVLMPDPARGEGFWFVSTNRSRSDGLSGFVGSMIRGKVRGEAEKGMQAALRFTKTKMERP